MRKFLIVCSAAFWFALSCGSTAFVGEPSFIQYPFQELTRFNTAPLVDGYIKDIAIYDVDNGYLLITVHDESILDDVYYFWNGESILDASYPVSRDVLFVVPLPDMNRFVTLEYDTSYYLSLYSVTETGDGSASYTLQNERLFDTAEFPGLPSGYGIDEIHYAEGRIYGRYHDLSTDTFYFLSYAVDGTAISDPKLELSSLPLSDADTQLFSEADEIVGSQWQTPLPGIDTCRYIPDLSAVRCIFSKQLNSGEEEYWTAAEWDGTTLAGESAIYSDELPGFSFLQDGTFLEKGWYSFGGIEHWIRNVALTELGVIRGFVDINHLSDGVVDGEHVLFYYFEEAEEDDQDVYLMYLPISSITE